MAITSARAELDALLRGFLIAVPAYERLRQELDARLEQVNSHISAIYAKNEPRIRQEVEIARSRLIAAEKSSIEQSFHEGLISRQTAAAMIDDANRRQEEIELKSQGEACE